MTADLTLETWDDRGLVLARRANVPAMQVHLGGPEPDAALVARHERITRVIATGTGMMFLIVLPGEPDPVGSVGYWDREWQGHQVYEMGWKVLPAFQGRGLAAAATVEAVRRAAADGRHAWAHAFPSVGNAASNAVCRRAGFELVGECDVEFPPGQMLRSNDWRHDLTPASGSAAGDREPGSA